MVDVLENIESLSERQLQTYIKLHSLHLTYSQSFLYQRKMTLDEMRDLVVSHVCIYGCHLEFENVPVCQVYPAQRDIAILDILVRIIPGLSGTEVFYKKSI
jgi:hypothetical protein